MYILFCIHIHIYNILYIYIYIYIHIEINRVKQLLYRNITRVTSYSNSSNIDHLNTRVIPVMTLSDRSLSMTLSIPIGIHVYICVPTELYKY